MIQTNLIGKNILGYTVSEKLGSGAFGTVYKVIKTNVSGCYVRALKHITIPTEKQYNSVLNSMGGDVSKADSYFAQMLNNIVSEIKILNDLSEKGMQHIVRYYENDIIVSDTPKRYDIFILMEYLTPLENYIQSERFLVRDVVKLGLDVLHGLQSCHDNGVIHRDIKDDNIFVFGRGEYKIGDFGVSKVLKDSSRAESLKGTPNFLAPEVYLGKENYTKSVDLYSLGIVLYRLLNYSRNPFLPRFPKQYFAEDEDSAFEERMSGKIPDLPPLGGTNIGQVVVKAVSSSAERFQTANEFITALESAIDLTSVEKLNENTKIGIISSTQSLTETEQKQYNSTLCETSLRSISEEKNMDEQSNSINKHLFESIGESVLFNDILNVEPVLRAEQKNRSVNKISITPPKINGRVGSDIRQDKSKLEEPATMDKKVMDKFIYAIPVVIILIGIVVFFIMVPNMYGKTISFLNWIFTNPQNIIDALRDSNTVLPKVYSILGLRIFWWIWLAGLIISLFFVSKQLNVRPELNDTNAILKKKEPYLMIQEINDALKQLKIRTSNKRLDSILYAVKKLEEKLSCESDFGYGKREVINCENKIAIQLQLFIDITLDVEYGDFEEKLKTMDTITMNINALLRRRIELKKR